ncbi:hypothetical protein DZF91_11730 [Actinomadura logoneensis]|uniref:Uncharacterized protein n=1 Tax=Actinomadura logoneensis TaxID=2293572 RepID=A0A372JNA8_9ACTN|nr:hypothetical protein DZF91_11730 [Actinomadura logoneensis]
MAAALPVAAALTTGAVATGASARAADDPECPRQDEIFFSKLKKCVVPDDDPTKRRALVADGQPCIWVSGFGVLGRVSASARTYQDGESDWSWLGIKWTCRNGEWIRG